MLRRGSWAWRCRTHFFILILFIEGSFGFPGTGSSVLLLIKMDHPRGVGGGGGGGGGAREFEEGAKGNKKKKPSAHLF
jgi:hypothetical protein